MSSPITTSPPISPLSRQIRRTLWSTVGLSTLILGVSLGTFGFMSLFIGVSGSLLSLALSITNLSLLSKAANKPPEALTGKLPCTATVTTIVSSWAITIVWLAAAGVALVLSGVNVTYPDMRALVVLGFVEGLLELGAAVLVGSLALKCTTQRQEIIGIGNSVKWYQIGRYGV